MARMLAEPEIGQWYRDIQNRFFEVVAFDDDAIEVQFYDGDVEELDLETWELLSVIMTEAPGDGAGPYDEPDTEFEDYMHIDEELHPISWDSLVDDYGG